MTPLYTATAWATNGREGTVKSDDGSIDLPLAMPKSLGGTGAAGATNPEQLFAAGYAACFGSALKLVAGKLKVDASQVVITSKVSLVPEGAGFGLSVELIGSAPNLSRDELAGLMDKAHGVCPYSKATKGNMPVSLSVA